MPEPNHKDPAPATSTTTYGWQALDTLKRQGVQFIEFWCVGSYHLGRKCEHWVAKPIDDVIRRAGPGTSLVMLARRARCDRCKKMGCHVQPSDPPCQGQHGFRDWLREEMERSQRFLVWAREQL